MGAAVTGEPVNNRDPQIARNYHEGTKHSAQSIRADPHPLDWKNQPLPFKIYPGLNPIPFPADLPPSEMGALSALSRAGTGPPPSRVPDLETLGRLLLLSAGITKKRSYPGGETLFRAAACTGAL
jgi:hypothetical protein